jgi:hypothetical protein
MHLMIKALRVAAVLALVALVIKIAPTPTDLVALQSGTYAAPAAAAPRTR